MKLRRLGKTELQVSEIGFGGEWLERHPEEDGIDLIHYASAQGINILDCWMPDPKSRDIIGKGIKDNRRQWYIQGHIGSTWKDEQYFRTRDMRHVRPAFEDLLKRLQTDYIDLGMIHYVDTMDTWNTVANGEVMRYALEQKRAGRIRCIGLSSHNPEVALAAVESGLVEVLMFSVNPCYDLQPAGENCEALWAEESYAGMLVNMDPARERLYETCQRLGVGITVMKAFGGGDLLKADSPAGVALTVEQCIHYALTRPAVASVMSGVHTSAELAASLAYETAPDSARDYAAALATFPKISWRGHCMYCGHCAPCPKGIDVASVTKFLNLARAQGMVPETVREHYAALAHKAGECIACGACSKRCPFGVDAVENMRRAEETFGA